MLQRPHRVSGLKVSSWLLMGWDETLFMEEWEGRGWTAGQQTPRQRSWLPNSTQTATQRINREFQVWVKQGPVSASGLGNPFPSTQGCTLIKNQQGWGRNPAWVIISSRTAGVRRKGRNQLWGSAPAAQNSPEKGKEPLADVSENCTFWKGQNTN